MTLWTNLSKSAAGVSQGSHLNKRLYLCKDSRPQHQTLHDWAHSKIKSSATTSRLAEVCSQTDWIFVPLAAHLSQGLVLVLFIILTSFLFSLQKSNTHENRLPSSVFLRCVPVLSSSYQLVAPPHSQRWSTQLGSFRGGLKLINQWLIELINKKTLLIN